MKNMTNKIVNHNPNKYKDEIPMDDYEKELAEEAAERYFELKRNKSVTLRVSSNSLFKVKAKAKKRNIPYQTLINMLINDYADGKLKLAI